MSWHLDNKISCDNFQYPQNTQCSLAMTWFGRIIFSAAATKNFLRLQRVLT